MQDPKEIEKDTIIQLCINCISWTERPESISFPWLFCGWGEFGPEQFIRLQILKRFIAESGIVAKKTKYLEIKMRYQDLEGMIIILNNIILPDKIISLNKLPKRNTYYNSIIALCANLNYYEDRKDKKSVEYFQESLAFVLTLDLDLTSLQRYTKDLIEKSNLTKAEEKNIEEGLDILKSTYYSKVFRTIREENAPLKKVISDNYTKVFNRNSEKIIKEALRKC
jgi:hypothetical protein